MFPASWEIKAGAALLAIIAALGVWLWVQDMQHDLADQTKIAADATASVGALTETAAKTKALQEKADAATKDATLRAQVNARARDAADATAASLRNDLNTANQRLRDAPDQAVREYASTLGAVFADCQDAYRGMARQADGHANDAKQLSDSWPVDPGQPGK